MEGPCISPKQCGAQNSRFCHKSDIAWIKKLIKKCKAIKRITIAPEVDIEYKLAKYLNKNNVLVSAGHTDCLFQEMNRVDKLSAIIYRRLNGKKREFID